MAATRLIIITSEKLPFDQSRVVHHESKPNKLELMLSGCGDQFRLNLNLRPYWNWGVSIGSYKTKEEAEESFRTVYEKLRRGEYKLHLHDSGHVDFEIIPADQVLASN